MLCQIRKSKFQALPPEPVTRLRNHVQNSVLRRLPQNARGLASLIAINPATLRIPAGQRNAGQLQSASVGYRDMPVNALQKHGMPIRYFVQIPARRRNFDGPQGFVPSRSQNPISRLRLLDLLLYSRAQFIQRLRARTVDAKLHLPRIVKMEMGVVKSGHDEMSVQVDHVRLRPF